MAYVFDNSEWTWRGGDAESVRLGDFTAHRSRPFYLYDLDDLDERIALLKSAFAGRVHYAVKANADPRVLAVMRAHGLGVDVVSLGEMQAALTAGFAPDRIIFSGVGKDREELTFALAQRIYQINVESFEELKALSALARERHAIADIGLRVNINLTAPTHRHIQTATETSKFGIDLEMLPEVLAWIGSRPQLRLKGLAVHIGSQILDVSAFERMTEQMGALYRELNAAGAGLKRLDLGGGLGLDYGDGPSGDVPRLELYKAAIARHGTDAELAIEPGRWLTARMGALICRVVHVKVGRARKFLILNAGMNALMRPALYQAYHRIEPLSPRPGPRETYAVVGPVCESTDVFADRRELPPCEPGDWVAIFDAGAYGAVMATTYNETPVPERWSIHRGRREVIA